MDFQAQIIQHRAVCAVFIGKAHILKPQGHKIRSIILQNLIFRHRIFLHVQRKLLDLHQPLGRGHHGIILGKYAGNIGKGGFQQVDKIHDRGHGTVGHGVLQKSPAAHPHANNLGSGHGPADSKAAQVYKPVPPHPGSLQLLHIAGRGLFCGRLPGKGMDHQKAGKPFLNKAAHFSVAFLHRLMIGLEIFTQHIGKCHHHRRAGQQHIQDLGNQHQQRQHHAGQPHQQPEKLGNDIGRRGNDHIGIRGDPVHPFAGMLPADPCIIPPQKLGEDVHAEFALQHRAALFGAVFAEKQQDKRPQIDGGKDADLGNKPLLLPCGSTVDHIFQGVGIQNGIDTLQDPHQRQQADPFFAFAGHPVDPPACSTVTFCAHKDMPSVLSENIEIYGFILSYFPL